MVTISERPAEAADRAVPGHWEGDLICGSHNRSAVGTLVERSTRYVMLLHLPDGHEAIQVEKAMKQAIGAMPTELFKTLTWDRGKEMARHKEIKVATGVQVYFCDPHAPWQRGSNENTTRLLRQFLPRSTDLNHYSRADLTQIARLLNDRPRKTLGFMKPSEKLAALVALTPSTHPPGRWRLGGGQGVGRGGPWASSLHLPIYGCGLGGGEGAVAAAGVGQV
jgi:IS30 family transposase